MRPIRNYTRTKPRIFGRFPLGPRLPRENGNETELTGHSQEFHERLLSCLLLSLRVTDSFFSPSRRVRSFHRDRSCGIGERWERCEQEGLEKSFYASVVSNIRGSFSRLECRSYNDADNRTFRGDSAATPCSQTGETDLPFTISVMIDPPPAREFEGRYRSEG